MQANLEEVPLQVVKSAVLNSSRLLKRLVGVIGLLRQSKRSTILLMSYGHDSNLVILFSNSFLLIFLLDYHLEKANIFKYRKSDICPCYTAKSYK